jgi:hypothetical protein
MHVTDYGEGVSLFECCSPCSREHRAAVCTFLGSQIRDDDLLYPLSKLWD